MLMMHRQIMMIEGVVISGQSVGVSNLINLVLLTNTNTLTSTSISISMHFKPVPVHVCMYVCTYTCILNLYSCTLMKLDPEHEKSTFFWLRNIGANFE